MNPGANGSTPAVQLECLSYSPVAGARGDEDFWAEVAWNESLPEGVRERFSNYVRRAAEDPKGEFEEVVFEGINGTAMKRRLVQLMKLKTADDEERRDLTKAIANDLSEHMAKTSNPAPGAIFAVQAKVGGKRSLALVKLDLSRREIVALREEMKHALDYTVYPRALPDDAKTWRKAVLYPSPGSGDARFRQLDSESDYWRKFVGARPIRQTRRAAEACDDVIRTMVPKGKGQYGPVEAIRVYDKLSRLSAPTVEKVARVVRDETGISQRASAVEERLKEVSPGNPYDSIAKPKSIRYTFRQGMTLNVPAELLRDGTVAVEHADGDVVIRIKQSDFEFKPVFD